MAVQLGQWVLAPGGSRRERAQRGRSGATWPDGRSLLIGYLKERLKSLKPTTLSFGWEEREVISGK